MLARLSALWHEAVGEVTAANERVHGVRTYSCFGSASNNGLPKLPPAAPGV